MIESIWMEAERANMNETQLSLMLHMTMIQMCWHQTLKTCAFFVNHGKCDLGFARSTSTHFLSQEGTCDQTLKAYEGLQSPYESWQDSSKHKKNTSVKNFLRSSWPAYSSMKSRCVSVWQSKSVKRYAHIQSGQKKACLAAIAEL